MDQGRVAEVKRALDKSLEVEVESALVVKS